MSNTEKEGGESATTQKGGPETDNFSCFHFYFTNFLPCCNYFKYKIELVQFAFIQCRHIYFISFHFISFHFISFHFISFLISFHFISFDFISFHFISFHFISFHFISFHFISFHFISFHFISFHFISFHFISFHFISKPGRTAAPPARRSKATPTKGRSEGPPLYITLPPEIYAVVFLFGGG